MKGRCALNVNYNIEILSNSEVEEAKEKQIVGSRLYNIMCYFYLKI